MSMSKNKKKATLKPPTAQNGGVIEELPTSASAPRRGARLGLRSSPATERVICFEDDPESILRVAHKKQKAYQAANKAVSKAAQGPQPLTRANLAKLTGVVEHRPSSDSFGIDDGAFEEVSNEAPDAPDEDSDDELSVVTQDTLALFYRGRGHLPPLDKEVTAFLGAMAADPAAAAALTEKFTRRSPGSPEFALGLLARNVSSVESRSHDPYKDHVNASSPPKDFFQETKDEKVSFELLWKLDQDKCGRPANEALFQRTLMISLIARNCLIYERNVEKKPLLDFTVEEPWTCPPMPTRDFEEENTKCLTQPKPDLAVCFCRDAVLPGGLLNDMPRSVQRLMSYENLGKGWDKVFHFLTVEAKKSLISPANEVGLHQSLNNASQALHNMFEFFRDAGHEEIFYNKVRFFSVVASSEGLFIRIHRATKVLADRQLIMKNRPDYPINFEFRVFAKFAKDFNFDRDKVFQAFEKILHGYAVKELLPLLQEAAKALEEKLMSNTEQMKLRRDKSYYQYGQPGLDFTQTADKSSVNKSNVARTPLPTDGAMSLDA